MGFRHNAVMTAVVVTPVGFLGTLYCWFSDRQIPAFVLLVLFGGLAVLAVTFRGWPQVFARAGHGVGVAAPHVRAGANVAAGAVTNGIRDNKLLIAMLATAAGGLLLLVFGESREKILLGMFLLQVSALLAIQYFDAWDKWRIWQFLFVALNAAIVFYCTGNWMSHWLGLLFLAIMVVLSFAVMIGKENEAVETAWKGVVWLAKKLAELIAWLVKAAVSIIEAIVEAVAGWLANLFTGKYGADAALFAVAVIAGTVFFSCFVFPDLGSKTVNTSWFAIPATLASFLVAFVTLSGAALLFVGKRLVK